MVCVRNFCSKVDVVYSNFMSSAVLVHCWCTEAWNYWYFFVSLRLFIECYLEKRSGLSVTEYEWRGFFPYWPPALQLIWPGWAVETCSLWFLFSCRLQQKGLFSLLFPPRRRLLRCPTPAKLFHRHRCTQEPTRHSLTPALCEEKAAALLAAIRTCLLWAWGHPAVLGWAVVPSWA